MRKFPWAALCLSFVMPLTGCTVARIYATSGNKISLTDVDPGAGEPFKITHRIMFDYTSSIDVQELLRDRYGSGHQFQNVTLKLQIDVADYLVNLVTLGLAQSKTFEISGDRLPRPEQARAREIGDEPSAHANNEPSQGPQPRNTQSAPAQPRNTRSGPPQPRNTQSGPAQPRNTQTTPR